MSAFFSGYKLSKLLQFGQNAPQVGESSEESGKDEKENSHYQRVQRVRNKVSDFVRNSYGDSCEA